LSNIITLGYGNDTKIIATKIVFNIKYSTLYFNIKNADLKFSFNVLKLKFKIKVINDKT